MRLYFNLSKTLYLACVPKNAKEASGYAVVVLEPPPPAVMILYIAWSFDYCQSTANTFLPNYPIAPHGDSWSGSLRGLEFDFPHRFPSRILVPHQFRNVSYFWPLPLQLQGSASSFLFPHKLRSIFVWKCTNRASSRLSAQTPLQICLKMHK